MSLSKLEEKYIIDSINLSLDCEYSDMESMLCELVQEILDNERAKFKTAALLTDLQFK